MGKKRKRVCAVAISEDVWKQMELAYQNPNPYFSCWLVDELSTLLIVLKQKGAGKIEINGEWIELELDGFQDFVLRYFNEQIYQEVLDNVDL